MSRTPRTAPSIATAASRSCSSVCPPCPSRPPISSFDPGAAGMLRAIVHRELVIGLAAQHHRHLANRGIANDHGALYPLQKMPAAVLSFGVRLHRRTSDAAMHAPKAMLAANQKLVTRLLALGGKVYPPYAPVLTQEQWRQHYGS